jgi:hypothetical protein
MKKRDLKKLALMGITGGIIVASQSPLSANQPNTAPGTMLAGGCGSHGCSNTAYNERGYSQDYYSSYPQEDYRPQGQSGCQSRSNQGNTQYSSCSSRSSGQGYYQNSHGCSASSNSQGYYQSSNGCGASSNRGNRYTADNDMQTPVTAQPVETSMPQTEDQFKAKLSPVGKADFDKLSQSGKDKAVKMASHDCKGKNDCKGQNACKSDKNECAGKGGCKGQSKCASTPDQAVKAASMQDKRASMNTRNTYSPR